MKWLLLVLATRAWAVCPANVVETYEFQDNILAMCNLDGTYDLGQAGNSAYQSTCGSRGWSNDGTNTNYLTGPAALRTALSNLSSWTIELNDVYINSFVAQPVLLYYTNTDTRFIQVLSTGVWKVQGLAAGIVNSGANALATGICYSSLAVVYDGTNASLYVNNTLVGGPTAIGLTTGTVANLTFFQYLASPTFGLNGGVGRVKLWNKAYAGPFPSVSSVSANDCPSPDPICDSFSF